ncbi:MAG: ATP-binding cassette domain-containing protein [Candidatus Methanomethylicaceae archaeon]
MEKVPLIEMKKINKWFGSVHALVDVDFAIYEGEIVGLIGDNGAGKSTLIKILSGVLKADGGEIYYKGQKVKINSVKDSRKLGIETAFQEQAIIDCLTVGENIFATREPIKRLLKVLPIVDYERMLKIAEQELKKLGLTVPPEKEVGFCSGGEKQGVIIARNMHFRSKLVILDEPTRALSIAGIITVHEYIKQLKREGIACIYITHDLHHVYPIADRIVMLNRGRKVLDIDKSKVTLEQLEKMILKFAFGEK